MKYHDKKFSYDVVIMIILALLICVVLPIYITIFERQDCLASGGKFIQGFLWFKCI